MIGEGGDRSSTGDPTRIAHFRILTLLGKGGMGVVYRAEDEKLRRHVALKVLPDTSGNEERRQRFLREARSAAAITHPNVAVVYAVDEADGRIYIAMELVEGENLRARLDRGRLDVAIAKELAEQIARGLAAAHEKGIVHRDLKPENVMITPAGVVKLLDFGLAKAGVDRLASGKTEAAMAKTETVVTSDEGRIMGTPEYMSPEQAMGEPLDVRSDVFSLGIVLYEMLSGTRPFAGASTGAVLVAIARDTAPPLRERAPAVDEATEAVVMRCLAKAPAERFGSAGEIVAALTGKASQVATTESRTEIEAITPSVPVRRPRSARLVMLGLAAAALLALGTWRLVAPHASNAAAPAAIASASASATPPPPSLGGALPSSNPEAQRLFEQAMRSFQDGTGQAVPLLEAAVKADPGFAAAYLRLWVMVSCAAQRSWFGNDPSEHATEYHQRIIASQAALSPRDQELLDGVENPGDESNRESNAKLDAYLVRYPDDDVAWVARLDGRLDTARRAAAARPTLVPALAKLADDMMAYFETDGAADVLAQCLAISPRAVDCISARAVLHDMKGECAAAEADLRRWLSLQPDSRRARPTFAALLAAQHAPLESVRGALGADAAGPAWETIVDALVPMFEGDFAEVQRIAADASARVSPSAAESEHYGPASTLVQALTEAGDAAGAGRVAVDYLAHRAGWRKLRTIVPASMIRAAARAGGLGASEASRPLEDAFGVLKPISPGSAWLYAYADGVETPAEASAAVAKLDALGIALPRTEQSMVGRVLFLAGRHEDARPPLQADVTVCSNSLLFARNWVRDHLYLGELDEQAGNKPSACAHYAVVLSRWGHAKPRSVTADEARAHATKLGCAL